MLESDSSYQFAIGDSKNAYAAIVPAGQSLIWNGQGQSCDVYCLANSLADVADTAPTFGVTISNDEGYTKDLTAYLNEISTPLTFTATSNIAKWTLTYICQ